LVWCGGDDLRYAPLSERKAQLRSVIVKGVTGWEELFERERETHPDLDIWDACAMACEV